MGSIGRAPNTAPETAARIRDAALTGFAARGFTRTTVRDIAAAAGVSPGLVIHHFGSKEGLRVACDDHVFTVFTQIKRENAGRSPFVVAEMWSDDRMRSYADYLVKSLLDTSAQGQRFFDHYVETLEQVIEEGFAGYTLRKGADRRVQATAIAMLALAPLLLEPRVRHWLGTDDVHGSMGRLAPYLFDLYRHGFIASVPDELTDPDTDTPATTEGRP